MEWYKLGLRKDFLIHNRKTVESFGFVRADISSINNYISHFTNALSSIESRISMLDGEMPTLRKAIDKCSSEIGAVHSQSIGIQSKIGRISKSLSDAADAIDLFRGNIGKIASNSQQLSKSVASNTKAIKKLFLSFRSQSLRSKQLGSALKKSEIQARKMKNLVNQKLKAIKRRDLELESKVRSQRKYIASLNRKIKGKKAIRKIAKSPKPRKVIKKTITPKKTITRTETPKKIVEVFKTKKPVI